MNFLLKNLIIYSVLSFLSILIFIFYLSLAGYPGGSVGMAPFIVILNCLISFAISIILVIILKFKMEISLLKSAWIFTIIYFLTLLFYFGINPFKGGIDRMSKNINLGFYLCEIISFGLFYIRTMVRKNFA